MPNEDDHYKNNDLKQKLLDGYDDSSPTNKSKLIKKSTGKDTTLNMSAQSYNMIERYDSQELSGLIKSKLLKNGELKRSDTDKSMEWYKAMMVRLREEELQKSKNDQDGESAFYSFLKTCNLTFGALLFLLSNYGFLYCFEVRRYYVLTSDSALEDDLNFVFVYSQVLTIVIIPLVIIIFWKLKKCTKPLWVQLATTLIPLLIILSLIISSGRIKYDSIYLPAYMVEICVAILFAISLVVIKFTQKSLSHTFQSLIYTDMLLSISYYILRYMNLFIWIYADDELNKGMSWFEPIINPMSIIPAVTHTISMYLLAQMMWQSQLHKSSKRWSSSKIRISTLLCLKAFECEILMFISLFISIKYLDVADVFGMLIFIIAILIMS